MTQIMALRKYDTVYPTLALLAAVWAQEYERSFVIPAPQIPGRRNARAPGKSLQHASAFSTAMRCLADSEDITETTRHQARAARRCNRDQAQGIGEEQVKFKR